MKNGKRGFGLSSKPTISKSDEKIVEKENIVECDSDEGKKRKTKYKF